MNAPTPAPLPRGELISGSGKTRRRGIALGLRGAIGLAILAGILATQEIEWPALWKTMRRVDPRLLITSCAGFLVLMAVKSWRWAFLIRQAELSYGFWKSFRSYLAAFALGILTPGRLGELARAAQLRAEVGADLGPCVRSVVSDRLFDLIFLSVFGPLALWAVLTGQEEWGWFLIGLMVLYAAACGAASGVAKLVARWQPRWRPLQLTARFLDKVAGDLTGRAGLIGSAITFLAYGVYFGASLALLRAVEIDLSFRELAWVTGCLSLILLLPISIAGVGPREATLIFLLGRYGVSREDALAYSVLQFAVFTLFGGLTGSLALAGGFKHAKVQDARPRSSGLEKE